MSRRHQVIIVGGGPVGLALAVQLGLRGVICALVESRTKLHRIPKGHAVRRHGRALDAQGVREALYVSSNQTKAWQIYRGDSDAEVQRIVATFPLHPYLIVRITSLAGG